MLLSVQVNNADDLKNRETITAVLEEVPPDLYATLDELLKKPARS